ncbi:hypothetical protein EU642_21790 [Salmonella enterica]|nr:hypothetical protein [Salmonella enterica]EAO0118486.1 hypothetical protein [Salmonella enterica]EAO3601706.1 hypothetical protein [Salmonella enterica]EAR6391603.1 hypothetical protein [Salmonella enterica]EAV1285248.1 hypothetical protein [Salmonella enterica]
MSATTLPELAAIWEQLYRQRHHQWGGFRLPQRNLRVKALKVRYKLARGIVPRGRVAKRLLWIDRDRNKYL